MEGRAIRERRRTAALTQTALAERAGVSQPNLSAYETGRRTPSPEVAARIERALMERPSTLVGRHRQEIHDVVVAHHARAPRVFGSTARGDDGPGSDVDFLVEFTGNASILDEVGLRLTLQDLLHVPVDVVGLDSLTGEVRTRVLAEAVAV